MPFRSDYQWNLNSVIDDDELKNLGTYQEESLLDQHIAAAEHIK